MLYSGWQIGLDIQAEGIRAVALQWHRRGWQLRHWWHLPLALVASRRRILPQPDALREGLCTVRKQLPYRYRLRVSFPAQMTRQQKFSAPDAMLSEAEREKYLNQRVEHPQTQNPSHPYYDYCQYGSSVMVTSAQAHEVNQLLDCFREMNFMPESLTPCDKVLSALTVNHAPAGCRLVVHEEPEYWLWAEVAGMRLSGWQDKQQTASLTDLCLALNVVPDEVALSQAFAQGDGSIETQVLDAWQSIRPLQPPLPAHGGLYTVALGLAQGVCP